MPITSEERLREIYGPPHPRAIAKMRSDLDGHARAFIAASPFLLIATSDGERLDVSPRGDDPGFVQVDEAGCLLMPDWPGNSRIDGLLNLLRHPRVGMIFLIPSVRETLRVNGRATIHDEPALLERLARKGRRPRTVLRAEPDEVFLHCAKAFLRSGLWEPASWPEERPLPTMNEMFRRLADPAQPLESEEAMIERFRGMLY